CESDAGGSAIYEAIYEASLTHITGLSGDVESVANTSYVSLRRRKQFAMLQPARDRVDLGLILKATTPTERLESAASFNRLFTHRVRVTQTVVDLELAAWIHLAHPAAA